MGPLIVALMEIDLPLAIATDVRPFAAVGVPGGFTTFPGFAADVAVLWEGRGAHGACTP
jgi:fluoride ion exporter CrcB/FEX